MENISLRYFLLRLYSHPTIAALFNSKTIKGFVGFSKDGSDAQS